MSTLQRLLRQPNRQRRRRSLVSLTPLIDVVFILLIFLMLVSNFLDRSAFEISIGAAGDVAAPNVDASPLHLHLPGGTAVELDGVPVPVEDIHRRLARVTMHRDEPVVLVYTAAGVDLQMVITAMSAARRVPGLKVFLVRNGADR